MAHFPEIVTLFLTKSGLDGECVKNGQSVSGNPKFQRILVRFGAKIGNGSQQSFHLTFWSHFQCDYGRLKTPHQSIFLASKLNMKTLLNPTLDIEFAKFERQLSLLQQPGLPHQPLAQPERVELEKLLGTLTSQFTQQRQH